MTHDQVKTTYENYCYTTLASNAQVKGAKTDKAAKA